MVAVLVVRLVSVYCFDMDIYIYVDASALGVLVLLSY